MPGRAGSRTPKAPRSGARRNRFCRASAITGAHQRAHCARQNWRRRRILRAGPTRHVSWEIRRDEPREATTKMPLTPLAGSMPARGVRCPERQCLDLRPAIPPYETAARPDRLQGSRSWVPTRLHRWRNGGSVHQQAGKKGQRKRANTPPGRNRAGRCGGSVAAWPAAPRPDQVEGLAVLVGEQVGVDGGGEARIVELDREVVAALAGALGPSRTDFGFMWCTT